MIEIFQGENKEWYFRVKGKNGEIVATSEGYDSKGNAKRGINSLLDILTAGLRVDINIEVIGDEVE